MRNNHHIESFDFISAEENALMDFQFALIDAMNEQGMTKAELAETLGVTRARVSQLLSSEANPTIKLVGRALAAVGLKAEYGRKSKPSAKVREVVSKSTEHSWKGGFAVMACQAIAVNRLWGDESHAANENRWDRSELEAA